MPTTKAIELVSITTKRMNEQLSTLEKVLVEKDFNILINLFNKTVKILREKDE